MKGKTAYKAVGHTEYKAPRCRGCFQNPGGVSSLSWKWPRFCSRHRITGKVKLKGSSVLADRAYGAQPIRAYISKHGASYVIAPQSNFSELRLVDWHLYKERHLIECFFQKIKWFRRISTRYDKLDVSFLIFVCLAAIAILVVSHNNSNFLINP